MSYYRDGIPTGGLTQQAQYANEMRKISETTHNNNQDASQHKGKRKRPTQSNIDSHHHQQQQQLQGLDYRNDQEAGDGDGQEEDRGIEESGFNGINLRDHQVPPLNQVLNPSMRYRVDQDRNEPVQKRYRNDDSSRANTILHPNPNLSGAHFIRHDEVNFQAVQQSANNQQSSKGINSQQESHLNHSESDMNSRASSRSIDQPLSMAVPNPIRRRQNRRDKPLPPGFPPFSTSFFDRYTGFAEEGWPPLPEKPAKRRLRPSVEIREEVVLMLATYPAILNFEQSSPTFEEIRRCLVWYFWKMYENAEYHFLDGKEARRFFVRLIQEEPTDDSFTNESMDLSASQNNIAMDGGEGSDLINGLTKNGYKTVRQKLLLNDEYQKNLNKAKAYYNELQAYENERKSGASKKGSVSKENSSIPPNTSRSGNNQNDEGQPETNRVVGQGGSENRLNIISMNPEIPVHQSQNRTALPGAFQYPPRHPKVSSNDQLPIRRGEAPVPITSARPTVAEPDNENNDVGIPLGSSTPRLQHLSPNIDNQKQQQYVHGDIDISRGPNSNVPKPTRTTQPQQPTPVHSLADSIPSSLVEHNGNSSNILAPIQSQYHRSNSQPTRPNNSVQQSRTNIPNNEHSLAALSHSTSSNSNTIVPPPPSRIIESTGSSNSDNSVRRPDYSFLQSNESHHSQHSPAPTPSSTTTTATSISSSSSTNQPSAITKTLTTQQQQPTTTSNNNNDKYTRSPLPQSHSRLSQNSPSFAHKYTAITAAFEATSTLQHALSKIQSDDSITRDLSDLSSHLRDVSHSVTETQHKTRDIASQVSSTSGQLLEANARITDLGTRVGELGTRVHEMGGRVVEMGARVSSLQSQVGEFKDEIRSEMRVLNGTLRKILDTLKTKH